MTQWPSEYGNSNRESSEYSVSNIEQKFRQFFNNFSEELSFGLDEVVKWIIHQATDVSELESKIKEISEREEWQGYLDSRDLLMTWSCASALFQSPSLETWEIVQSFVYNSSMLEHWLTPAMIVMAEENLDAQKAYTKLAYKAFRALDDFSLKSMSERTNRERKQAFKYWNEREDKLGEIWGGMRWCNEMIYLGEQPLFYLWSKFELGNFIRTIEQSRNPCLVRSVLFGADIIGFAPAFLEWQKSVAMAAPAFDDNGKWNGSFLIPLLLVEAREQLLQARQFLSHQNVSDIIDQTKQQVNDIVVAVVTLLAKREDALPLFSRWSTWLMRQLLGHKESDVANIRSAAFFDEMLIEEIGRAIKGHSVIEVSPSDAMEWEIWCYRCVLASHANSGFIKPISSADFLAEWIISPDDWAGQKGDSLRRRASLAFSSNKELPGVAAHLLAYSIVQSESPIKAWLDMWDASYCLREIVEFGDSDSATDEYHSRIEAGQLLLLLFRIGIAIFDQRTPLCLKNDSAEARELVDLFKALSCGLREMCEIDDTLTQKDWLRVRTHLAIRRLIWETGQKSQSFCIFCPEDKPTFIDYLLLVGNDAFELIELLQSVILNVSDASHLKKQIIMSSIDITEIIKTAKRLNEYDSRRYPIDNNQLKVIEELFFDLQ
jgi:hypothetical protein